jgi:hypothetical protein
MKRALILTIGVGLGVGAVVSCAPRQTFPATVGEPFFDPGVPPVPEMMALAIQAAHAKSSARAEPIVFNLPSGAFERTWEQVWHRLPAGSLAAKPGTKGVTSVEQVRLDGSIGQVDVLVPQGEHYQLFTVHMQGGVLAAWKVTVVQPWTLRIEPPTINEAAPPKA